MQATKTFFLDWDFFAHSTLHRYRNFQNYPTLTGGITSILLIVIFVCLFSSLTLDTFGNNIINSQKSVNYDDDPTYAQMVTSSDHNFMFAVGLTGIDLSASQRYFDIYFAQIGRFKSSSGSTKSKEKIPLVPCTAEHWSGVSDSIAKSYNILDLGTWLCPPIGRKIELQGKYTSNSFKYADIKVGQCTQNNPDFPGTTCLNATAIQNFLNTNAQFTFNFYYINPVINSEEKEYIKYYLEDRTYFSFDTYTGVSANLFYNEFTITTDSTILPWVENSDFKGIKTDERATGQDYRMIAGEQYFKFYIRKGSSNDVHTRSYQKLDSTLSYIGGLFGTLIFLLSFLGIYSKYCYELDMGDRIFKQNHGGSFGSDSFNFVVFIGYLFYLAALKLNIPLNWTTMKRYHQCRTQCQKQLDIDLLFKKIAHFEEVSKVMMQDHQQRMLLMVPKPTIRQARINRKRFLIKSILYHQLDKKARDIHIQQDQYQKRLKEFLKGKDEIKEDDESDDQRVDPRTLKIIQEAIVEGYKKVQEQGITDPLSRRIMNRLSFEDIANSIVNAMIMPQFTNNDYNSRRHSRVASIEIVSQAEESAHGLFRNNKVANLDAQNAQFQAFDFASIFTKGVN